ncbi:MAG: RNA-binding cell elongation regulator Jag/EloR [Actinomycetota bacterium]
MREVERSAASVEEALEAALEELGVSEQEASIEIVQDSQRGLLGFGSQEAIVRVRVQDEDEGIDLEEQAEMAMDFLEGLLEQMDVAADLDHDVVDGTMYVDVLVDDDDSVGLLIGRHGQTLDALQELMRSAVQRQTESRCRVMVDIEDYRKRRRSQLAERARSSAAKVKRTGRPESMEPMNAYERKIVHDAANGVGGVETSSEGEDPERFVVISKSS